MSKKLLLILACLAASVAPASAQSDSAKQEAEREASRALTMFAGGDNFLGVHTESVTRETAARFNLPGEPRGVGVARVVENSAAAKAGLQKGDVILRFDGEPVASPQKLQRLIVEAAPNHAARITIWRDGSEREVTATLGRQEQARFSELFDKMPEFSSNGEEVRRRLEELQKQREELRKNGEQWGRQGEELRRQLEMTPRGNFGFAFNTGRRIGVMTTTLTDQLADYFGVSDRRGLLVTAVSENSPASKAGVRAGDVITEADGEKVSAQGELSRVINRKETGEVTLTIVRDKSRRTVRVTPEKSEGTPNLFVPGGLFYAPSIGALNLSDSLVGPARVIRLPESRRLAPLAPMRVRPITPRVVRPSGARRTIIL